MLAAIAAVTFHLVLPVAWKQALSVDVPYSPSFTATATILLTFLSFCAIVEPIRIRPRQWSTIPYYPPLWVAVLLGCLMAAGAECLPPDLRPQMVGLPWQQPSVLLPIIGAFVGAVFVRHLFRPRRSNLPATPSPTANATPTAEVFEADSAPNKIRDWLRAAEGPIRTAEQDLFDRRPVVARIARMTEDGRSVALLGSLGSGKSSIVNLVRAQLHHTATTVIVASLDVWAAERAEDVSRLALDRIVEALDDYTDTIALRNLPATYQRLVAATPAKNLAAVLGLGKERDSLVELHRLAPVLGAVNARLLLIVEDTERTGDEFHSRHLQRLLWALREVPRTSFVFATDPNICPSIDFSKLCDGIELLPPMKYEEVGVIVATAVRYWLSLYEDIDARPGRHRSKLQLESVGVGGAFEYLRRVAPDTPLDHLGRLLETPRHLKHVLRRVDWTWRQLHGEADLEDIIIMAALRESATPAYEFLVARIDAAREERDEMSPSSSTPREDCDRVIASLPKPAATGDLMELLNINQLSRVGGLGLESYPQGVCWGHPTDYFRRVLAEEVDAGEVRDQTVLRDIESYQLEGAESLIERLVADGKGCGRYSAIWWHFSSRHATGDDLAKLMSQVATRVLYKEGCEASLDHPALVALWQSCERLAERELGELVCTWITRGISVSLRFAMDIYENFTEESHRLAAHGNDFRGAIIETVRARVRSGSDLARILCGKEPYGLRRLVAAVGTGQDMEDLQGWREHLTGIVVDGARNNAEAILPEVANLLAGEGSLSIHSDGSVANPYVMDRERGGVLLEDRLEEVLERLAGYEGDNMWAGRAMESAGVWLRELRGGDALINSP